MSEKSKVKKPKHHLISVRLPHHLFELVEAKTEELETENHSETIRFLLSSALENTRLNPQLQYAVMAYGLIEEAIMSLVENPQSLIDRGEVRAQKLLEKFSK